METERELEIDSFKQLYMDTRGIEEKKTLVSHSLTLHLVKFNLQVKVSKFHPLRAAEILSNPT